jgi:hypothetical protein
MKMGTDDWRLRRDDVVSLRLKFKNDDLRRSMTPAGHLIEWQIDLPFGDAVCDIC